MNEITMVFSDGSVCYWTGMDDAQMDAICDMMILMDNAKISLKV
jgi:hypothetical protein